VFNDVVKDGENEENLDKCEIKGAKIFSSQPWGKSKKNFQTSAEIPRESGARLRAAKASQSNRIVNNTQIPNTRSTH
jgi:hypothetical protein